MRMRARLRFSGSSEGVTTSVLASCCCAGAAQPASRADDAADTSAAVASQPAVERACAPVPIFMSLRLLRAVRGHRLEHDRALLRDAPVHPGAVLHVAG